MSEPDTTAEDSVARLEALIDVGRAVTATLDLAEVLSLVVAKGAKAMGAHAAAILTPDPHSGTARVMNAHGLSGEFLSDFILESGVGIAGAALREDRPIWTEDVQADRRFSLPEERRRRVEAEGIRAVLAVPIPTSQRLGGVLLLYRRDPRPFDSDQIRFATLFADQAAIAIQNARR